MTLEELAGVDRDRADIETGEKLSHEAFYGRCIERLGGLEVVGKMVPFSVGKVAEAIQHDEHLNNLPLPSWDRAAGFLCDRYHVTRIGGGVASLCAKHGVSISCAEGVCLLKEAARELVELKEVKA